MVLWDIYNNPEDNVIIYSEKGKETCCIYPTRLNCVQMSSGYDPVNLTRIITALKSNLCLEVPGDATVPGQMLQVWDCHGGNNQLWNYTESRLVVNIQSGQCMDANGINAAGGPAVIQNKCNVGQWSQLWMWYASGWLKPDSQQQSCLAMSYVWDPIHYRYNASCNNGANLITSYYTVLVNVNLSLAQQWLPFTSGGESSSVGKM